MQGQVEEKTMAIIIDVGRQTGGRLTAAVLAKALGMTGNLLMRKTVGRDLNGNVLARGKMSMKNLMRKSGGLCISSDTEVMQQDLKLFDRCARKNGVDYHIEPLANSPNKYTVYLKAGDQETMLKLFQEFTASVLKKQAQKKPSIVATLRKHMQAVKEMGQKLREKVRNEPSL